jgi:hypothetical protein
MRGVSPRTLRGSADAAGCIIWVISACITATLLAAKIELNRI